MWINDYVCVKKYAEYFCDLS